MKGKLLLSLTILMFLICSAFAQDFVRNDGMEIPVPEADLNTGGLGNMVTADLDGDGRTDVFVINHNWNDADNEMLFRLYKYEFNGSEWEVVWSATYDVWKQNTWPSLTIGDLDNDGKKELIAGPVNWTDATDNPNPVRCVVFEHVGGSSDDMGVADGDNFIPNATTTITSESGVNLRPFRWLVDDVDSDGVEELIFADRTGNSSGWFFGVLSVDDVPDAADGSETWTVETNGLMLDIANNDDVNPNNKWDLAIIDNTIYFFDEDECTRVRATAADTYELLPSQKSVLQGNASWKSAIVADIDGNATEEIIVGTWFGDSLGVYIYTLDEAGDSLVGHFIASVEDWNSSYGPYGGALGDIDLNGQMDYVFGSRNATPNGAIFRLEYTGAQDNVTNADLWQLSIIDSLTDDGVDGGRWGVVGMANLDDDPNLEVLYTSSVPAGGLFGDFPQPIRVLDNTAQVVVGPWQKIDLPYVFVDVFASGLAGPHGIATDNHGRIWEAGYLGGQINVWNPDGTEVDFSPIDSVVVPKAGGGDTTITIASSRGLAKDKDGNIINAWNPWVVRIDAETGEGLNYFNFGGSPLSPTVDEDGYVYVGYVVGVSPVRVLDPGSFTLSQEIELADAPSFARGMVISYDGLTMYPGNLDNAAHANPIFTSTDYINYIKTDSIYTDNMGNPIFTKQSVTVDRRDTDGTIWYSQDNSYGGAGTAQLDNALVMFNFDTDEYGYLYMPEPRTDQNGPRGVAFSKGGDTLYVASSNGGAVYRYVHKDYVGIEDKEYGKISGFELNQNYPNPFNPTTEIEFTVAKAGQVSLTVYNMLGQKVATVVDKKMPMGTFNVTFDGSNLASGMYVYKLKASGVELSKKMMLIK